MTAARYSAGIFSLAVVLGGFALAAVSVRRRHLPTLAGAPALLATSLIALALFIGVCELLGTVGLFKRLPLFLAAALAGAAAVRAGGRGRTVAPRGGQAAHARARRVPGLATSGRLALTAAIMASAAVTAEWLAPSLASFDLGIRSFDSLWYHLPWAASFAHTGDLTALRFTDVEYLTAFYPATGELLHGVGIVLLGRDTLSPVLNLAFLGLALLAAWCIGAPHRLGPATLTGAAAALALPMVRYSQGGTAANDIVGIAFLLGSAALLVLRDDSRSERGSSGDGDALLILAGVAAGLAISVKLSLLAPALALCGAAVFARPERRAHSARRFLPAVIVGGGFWYLRNLIAVGNPLPWIGLGPLATPTPPLQSHTGYSVAHYVGLGSGWSRWFQPGLESGLGVAWPAVLALILFGALACLRRGSPGLTRALGAVAMVSLAAYLVTPESAAGPAGHPSGFAFNLRYAAPGIVMALALAPLGTAPRWRPWAVAPPALLLLVTLLAPRLWPAGYGPLALLIIALLLLAAAALARSTRRPSPRAAALLATAVAGSLFTAGYAGQRHYLNGRYRHLSRVSSLAPLWSWFRGVRTTRVALSGTFGGFFAYPLYGLDVSNRVSYVGHRGPHGSFVAYRNCRSWRAALRAGRFRLVVITPDRNPWRPSTLSGSPELSWTASDPAARIRFSYHVQGQLVAVFSLRPGNPVTKMCP